MEHQIANQHNENVKMMEEKNEKINNKMNEEVIN
jgi:hypothetical protein